MRRSKVAVTLDTQVLEELDALVAQRLFPSRSQAIEAALTETPERLAGTRLAREVDDLDPDEERALAEEGMASELASWPES